MTEDQVMRAYGQLRKRGDDSLAKNTFLASLRNQNTVGELRVNRSDDCANVC